MNKMELNRRVWRYVWLRRIIFLWLVPILVWSQSYFKENPPPSIADHLHLSHPQNSIDKGWLANMTGLPGSDQVQVIQQLLGAFMSEDKNSACTSVDEKLRKVFFQHFLIYQQMANAQHVYFDDNTAYQWAHILAMTLKESSGDPTNITAMSGRSISTHQAKSSLDRWKKISSLTPTSTIPMNYQTNFGLTQTSADRLIDAFDLAKDQRYQTEYLEGRKGAETPRKINLDTAIAIRRLIWFYQDLAQGRTDESKNRIPQKDINNPEYSERYQKGLRLALLYCGTRDLFRDGHSSVTTDDEENLLSAMASIAYCKLGNSQTGYVNNPIEQSCFAKWVTLCPALNIDIASLTPLSYFATEGATPLCEDEFKRLIKRPSDLTYGGILPFAPHP